jgi:hypothetical protein
MSPDLSVTYVSGLYRDAVQPANQTDLAFGQALRRLESSMEYVVYWT